MPCNSISVASAQLTEEQLLKMLTSADLQALLGYYAAQVGLPLTQVVVSDRSWNAGTVSGYVGQFGVTITPQGRVSVSNRTSSRLTKECQTHAEALTALLKVGGFQATARAAAEVLRTVGSNVTSAERTIEDQGALRQALVLTLRY